jgi:nucleoside-diphosphate-sugar epimerase
MGAADAGSGLPSLVITGASGFLGRHLIAALRDRYRIFGLARRAQQAVGIPAHPNVAWFQVDISHAEPLAAVFRVLGGVAGPKVVLHLAAHYDFTGEDHPEYWRTNVEGLRRVLEHCKVLRPMRFFFASSVAASRFPPPGWALSEVSPADGEHLYARTKRRGEEMLGEYAAHFPSCIVRLGALFSDWCEYPPLYMFLGTWLSEAWNSRILGGRGHSAIPYLHVRSAVTFFVRLLERESRLDPGEVLVASTDGAVSHLEIFEAATLAYYGSRRRPILMPRPLARAGLRAMDLLGQLQGHRPFERPWMGKYIDLQMTVDGSRTRARLAWSPNPRLWLIRRMPFLVENLKIDPIEWNRRNWAALKPVEMQPNLNLYRLIELNEQAIVEASLSHFLDLDAGRELADYRRLDLEELRWAKQQIFLHLKNAVRTRERALFKAYCRDLATRRFRQGFPCQVVCHAFETERDICLCVLRADPRSQGLEGAIRDHVAMTFAVGVDQIQDIYEELSGQPVAPETA